MALVSRSDESALAELYDRVGGTAYGLAYRVLRDEALAEDAVQEAFLGLWRSAGSFIPERAKASTWILTLVHRRAVDLVRREQRRRTESLEGAPEPAEGSAEEAAWLRLDRERVQTALAQLPDQQREAIELAYYGGYTQSELADRLGQPLGTIKSRMFSGLSRLRELLDEWSREELMDLHDLTAGYALDALDPDDRTKYEEHLASCEPCRDELQGFWQVSGSLARAAGGPAPPAALRERILEQARSERTNVVPLPRRFTPRAFSAVAAVAAVAAIGLGIWATSLSRDLDRMESERAVIAHPDARTVPERGRRGRPRGRAWRGCRAHRPDARAGAGGQGLRDLGDRERRPEGGRHLRGAGRGDALPQRRAGADGRGHARAGRRPRRAERRAALHRDDLGTSRERSGDDQGRAPMRGARHGGSVAACPLWPTIR